MAENEIKITLKDAMDEPGKQREIEATVSLDERGIFIDVKGYSDISGGEVVVIELADGEARVVIYGNRDQEDPTHIISLEGAKGNREVC